MLSNEELGARVGRYGIFLLLTALLLVFASYRIADLTTRVATLELDQKALSKSLDRTLDVIEDVQKGLRVQTDQTNYIFDHLVDKIHAIEDVIAERLKPAPKAAPKTPKKTATEKYYLWENGQDVCLEDNGRRIDIVPCPGANGEKVSPYIQIPEKPGQKIPNQIETAPDTFQCFESIDGRGNFVFGPCDATGTFTKPHFMPAPEKPVTPTQEPARKDLTAL